ncbi:MAG: radical SAM protein [Candidatus Helarchaeota archaeon]
MKTLQNIHRWNVGWGFSFNCNMNCSFCYSKIIRFNTKKRISLKSAMEFVNVNGKYFRTINYGTGENTIVKDWFKLIDYIHINYPHILQGVTTNGSLFLMAKNNPKFKTIFKNSINDCDISIDFGNEQLHNMQRSNSHAYKYAVNSLNICKEYDIERSIVMVATNDTFVIPNLKKIFRLADKFDANVRINIYRPVIKTFFNEKFILSTKKFYSSLKYILTNYNLISASDPLISSLIGVNHCIGDCSGRRSFRILPNGKITPSTYLIEKDWFAYDIIENPNFDISNLHKLKPFKKLLESKIPPVCYNCHYIKNCQGGAFDRRWLWYHNLELCDPYCPFRYYDNNPLEDIDYQKINRKPLVHDNYLPTLIFHP